MFNLLPKIRKETVRREYRIRLVIVSLWLAAGVIVISSILLLPSYILSSEREKAAEERFATLSKSIDHASAKDLNAVLADTKSHLALLSLEAPKISLHELLVLIVSIKNNQISLTNISLIKSAEKKIAVDISGISESRSALLSFKKALEQTKRFEKVEVPISNFAKDTDIDFSVRASLVF